MFGRRWHLGKITSRGWVMKVGVAGALLMPAPAALAALAPGWSAGKTSQHGVVRVYVAARQVVELIIELRARCTDRQRRDIWPGFETPFQHSGRTISDSYDIVGRDAATGVRFRQQASFKARRNRRALIGSAVVRQTLIDTGVVCQSPRVSFRVRI